MTATLRLRQGRHRRKWDSPQTEAAFNSHFRSAKPSRHDVFRSQAIRVSSARRLFLASRTDGNGVPSLRAASIEHSKAAAARSTETPLATIAWRRSLSSMMFFVLQTRAVSSWCTELAVRKSCGHELIGRRHSPCACHRAELARLLLAHLAASVFIGSTLSHFRQTSRVLPVRSVMASNRFLQAGQRLVSIGSSSSMCTSVDIRAMPWLTGK